MMKSGDPGTGRARIQVNNYRNPEGIREISLSSDMKLSAGFKVLLDSFDRINWMTIAEFWNEPAWASKSNHFRVVVGFEKKALGFVGKLAGQKKVDENWVDIWRVTGVKHVPIAEWFKVKIDVIEGERGGSAYFILMSNGQEIESIVVKDYTHHPDQAVPNGFWGWNPIKFCTNAKFVEFAEAQRSPLFIEWDNFSNCVKF